MGDSTFKGTGNLQDTCRVLLDGGADELLINSTEILRQFHGPLAAFTWLQQNMYPPFHTLPTSSKLKLATTYAERDVWHNTPLIIEAMLNVGGAVDPEIIGIVSSGDQNFIHSITQWWADAYLRRFKVTSGFQRFPTVDFDETVDYPILDKFGQIKSALAGVLSCELLICIICAGLSIQRVDRAGRAILVGLISAFLVGPCP